MKTKVLIEAGFIHSDLQVLNIDGVKVDKAVPITVNFDKNNKIGEVTPYIENGKIYADIDVDSSMIGLFPAIGFMANNCDIDEENGKRIIKSASLYEVSLCNTPNVDPNIKPLE